MEAPTKAEWSIKYEDGSEKQRIHFDTRSEHVPDHIWIDDDTTIHFKDAAWVAARLLDAAAMIASQKEQAND